MQPGQTIDPGSQTPSDSQAQPQPESNPSLEQPVGQQQVATEPSQLPTEAAQSASEPPAERDVHQEAEQNQGESADTGQPEQERSDWQFDEEADAADDSEQTIAAAQSSPEVEWTASEYVTREKNAGWYLLATLATLAVSALIYMITRDVVSPIVILIMGIAFVVFAARKPRVLGYAITGTGIIISQKHYPFGLFRTFSIIEEDAVRSILLMPMRRFNLPIYIYYEPSDEPRIIDVLSAHLPHEDRQMNPVDNLMRKIRF